VVKRCCWGNRNALFPVMSCPRAPGRSRCFRRGDSCHECYGMVLILGVPCTIGVWRFITRLGWSFSFSNDEPPRVRREMFMIFFHLILVMSRLISSCVFVSTTRRALV
jgi:hypothetical protein